MTSLHSIALLLLAVEAAPQDTARVDALLGSDERIVEWLVSHNASVLAARARIGQARAGLSQSRLLPNPTLTAGLGDLPVGATNPPGLGFDETAIYGATLSETVEIGKRGPRICSAELRLAAARESYLDAVADALGVARAALGRVGYLRSRQAALEESLADAEQMVALMRSRYEHGDVSGNDLDRLVLDDAVLKSEIAQNGAEYRAALAACAAALFATCEPGDADLRVVENAAPASLDPGWEDHEGDRPDVRALAFSEQSAREDAVLGRRRAVPDPTLNVGYTRDKLVISGDQPRTLSFGISFPIPLFDRGQKEAARAELQAEELKQGAAALLARARADTAALLDRKTTLERTLADLREGALPRSKAILDSTVAAVSQGELSTTDLLLARRTHTDLVLKLMDIAFAAFSARSDLRQAAGLDAGLVRKKEGDRWTQP